MKLTTTKSITLIEMAAVIVVLGLSIPVLLTMWADVAWRSSKSELMADAIFYAQQLIEEIKGKSFDENGSLPWTATANFGVDSGEVKANKDTYDDVDDYVGSTDSHVTTPMTTYARSVNVEYVRLVGTTWQGCGVVASCSSALSCSNCTGCCYKRVEVRVRRTDRLGVDVTLSTMMSGY